jgi:hypothetical protein
MKSNQDRQRLRELNTDCQLMGDNKTQRRINMPQEVMRINQEQNTWRHALKPEKLMLVSKQHHEQGVPRNYWAPTLEYNIYACTIFGFHGNYLMSVPCLPESRSLHINYLNWCVTPARVAVFSR